MTDRERLDAFRGRFGIEVEPEAAKRFATRVFHAAKQSILELEYEARYHLEGEFAFRNGSKLLVGRTVLGDPRIAHGILEEFEGADGFTSVVERTQHLLWSFEARGYKFDQGRHPGAAFASRLEQAIQLSPGINLRIEKVEGRVELAPAGVPLLDEAVDQSIAWLGRYPDVQKEYRQALTILAERKSGQYRQAQDSLRFGLEKLLKLLLGNEVRLEDQGKPLKEWLSQRGMHDNLRDVAVQILRLLTKHYQNAAVKHDNTVAGGVVKLWSDFEVEYVIYQYAAFIRLFAHGSRWNRVHGLTLV